MMGEGAAGTPQTFGGTKASGDGENLKIQATVSGTPVVVFTIRGSGSNYQGPKS